MTMWAEIYHNPLSAKWSSRTASGRVQSRAEGLRTRIARGVNPAVGTRRSGGGGREETDGLAREDQENPPPPLLWSVQALVDGTMPPTLMRMDRLHSLYGVQSLLKIKISCFFFPGYWSNFRCTEQASFHRIKFSDSPPRLSVHFSPAGLFNSMWLFKLYFSFNKFYYSCATITTV